MAEAMTTASHILGTSRKSALTVQCTVYSTVDYLSPRVSYMWVISCFE
jgi:hypothetical protein